MDPNWTRIETPDNCPTGRVVFSRLTFSIEAVPWGAREFEVFPTTPEMTDRAAS
jgi:hypothetical protein